MSTPRGGREPHLDAMRGLACLLLVAYHVIGNDAEHGLHVGETSNWRLFTEIFIHIRMPLFSFLSGYVFSIVARDAPALRQSIVKKLRRLGIPFLVVSTLFYVTFGIANHDFSLPIWKIYLLPYEHYWYLQATLLIMIGLLIGNYVTGGHARPFATALFPVACAVFVAALTFDPDIFAIGSALYLLPYFLLGLLLRLWSGAQSIGDIPLRRRLVLGFTGVALVILFALDLARLDRQLTLNFDRQSLLGLIFGISACLFLFFMKLRAPILAFIGVYSYSIYLFHVFFTAAVRKALMSVLPDTPNGVYFVLALVAGVLCPIALHRIAVRNRWTALLLLGIDRRPDSGPSRAGLREAPRDMAAP